MSIRKKYLDLGSKPDTLHLMGGNILLWREQGIRECNMSHLIREIDKGDEIDEGSH